jgi:AAA+ superfamily predicted ATPase
VKLTKISDLFSKSTDPNSDGKLGTLEILRELSTIVSLSANLSGNKKLARAVTGISVATSITTVGSHFFDLYKKRGASSEFVVKISETDPVFAVAEKWLNDAIPEDQQRSVFVRTETPASANYANYEVPDHPVGGSAAPTGSGPARITLKKQMDGTITQSVTIAGFPVTIATNNPSVSDDKKKKDFYTARSIVITCRSFAAHSAVLGQLELEAQKLVNQKPTFNTSTSWGSFRTVSVAPTRPIESVILKDGQMERILSFMRRFLDNEETYVKLGIPYRTGLMLHGNPGSGKSSTATAIANELGLNIYYISLSGLDDDDSLARAFNEIPAYSLAVLEDVDVYSSTKIRTDKDTGESKGITKAGLLNCLDGLTAPHGVITVMTTNHINSIDPAIIRPGRVDLMEELNELDTDQLYRLCEYFIGYVPFGLGRVSVDDGITSAQIVDIIRKYIPNVEDAANDIVDFIGSKVPSFTK